MKYTPLLLVVACCLLTTAVAFGQDARDSTDTDDHPLVTRYRGSFIDGYEVRDFDSYTLPVGPAVVEDTGNRAPSEKVVLEGKITRILYRGPEGRSTLEILRNYQGALEAAGFETLFSCDPNSSGTLFHWIFYKEIDQRMLNTRTSGSAFDIPQELRYLAAKGTVEGATVHVSVLVAFDAGFSELSKRPVTLLEIIETEAMETGMVKVNAEDMAEGIDATGHIAIYGIHFDTDSADIKPESADTLTEIGKLLQMRSDLDLLVVGHTDNQGRLRPQHGSLETTGRSGDKGVCERVRRRRESSPGRRRRVPHPSLPMTPLLAGPSTGRLVSRLNWTKVPGFETWEVVQMVPGSKAWRHLFMVTPELGSRRAS